MFDAQMPQPVDEEEEFNAEEQVGEIEQDDE